LASDSWWPAFTPPPDREDQQLPKGCRVDGEWNQIEIIARGNVLVHMINGQVITVTVDDNPDVRAFQEILSLQLEGSGQIWYRNVYVKNLD